jgi:hypothetical protein
MQMYLPTYIVLKAQFKMIDLPFSSSVRNLLSTVFQLHFVSLSDASEPPLKSLPRAVFLSYLSTENRFRSCPVLQNFSSLVLLDL